MISRDNAAFKDDSHMLDFDAELTTVPCQLKQDDSGWCARDTYIPRFAVGRKHFAPHIYPDKKTEVHFQDADYFFTEYWDALSAFLLVRVAGPVTFGFSLQIETDEHFCGTGERFYRIDLFGRSIDLVNENAHGVNTPRSYKNVPFLLSSRPYGVFVHSAAKMKLDIGAHSSRSLQWFVEEDNLDIFFIGGGSFQQIIQNYQKITGFPSMPPLWSFGTWMSRCTYESEQEVSQIAKRLREENYPVDVLHLDPGWFAEDWANNWWKCSWTFNLKAFPDPSRFMQHMRQQGFHISIWIYGFINPEVELSKTARENEYVGKITDPDTGVEWGDTLDFSNPDTIKWYKDLLKPLLRFGVATFKTDFGENIDESAIYKNIAPPKYRNLFGHLFQKATWETIAEMTGEPIIWARSGWAGSQRYPIHWSADCSSTFDGVANSLWGGLQIGLSGFAFWSHDIGGFYALKDAMTVKPDEILYLRWTQHGVFSSHMRYHGLTPREPWEYPGVADIVRQWLRFRYSLIPYIVAESDRCCKSGLPLLRALVFDWTDDPAVWCISDQYLFGSDFMICPVFNKSGIRNVYLPEGKWNGRKQPAR